MKMYVRKLTLVIAAFACVAIPLQSQTTPQDHPLSEGLVANRPRNGEVSPAAAQSYSMRLKEGDYVSGSIAQQGPVNIFIYQPDGSFLRRFQAPLSDGKRQFAFSAEAAGDYRVELAATEKVSRYELLLNDTINLDERLRQEAWMDPNPSPRIKALRQQIDSTHFDTENFWKQVAQEGTPFVEPVGTDGKDQLVTFLWRSTFETRNVLVLGSFRLPGIKPLDLMMHRLSNSDIFYLTLEMPTGARFDYQLSPNDPLAFSGPRAQQRVATAQADPLNPHRWHCPQGASKFICHSLVELPGAVPQPWIVRKTGVLQGQIEKRQIRSEIQKLDRSISVYTPPGYKPDGPTSRLLVLFDGDDYMDAEHAMPITMDNLIAASKIPSTVAVLVCNVSGRRLKDLIADPQFADFVAKELMTWVHSHYNVTSDPGQTIVGGYSAGGLAAAYMGLRYPNVFGNVISQSGSFWWMPDQENEGTGLRQPESNWMAKQFIASPKLPVRFYLEAGTFEADMNGTGGGILESTRQLRDVLLAKGYEVHYQQFVGGHDGASWRGTLADALVSLGGASTASLPLSSQSANERNNPVSSRN